MEGQIRRNGAHSLPDRALAELRSDLRDSRKALKFAIQKAKSHCWKEMLASVDSDPWGRPYKMVMGKLRGPSPITQTEQQTLEGMVNSLFPVEEPLPAHPAEVLTASEIPLFTEEEIDHAVKRIKPRNTAPGPDGISNKILGIVHSIDRTILRNLFDECLKSGSFPESFKKSWLMLLRKGAKPPDSPSSYRPLY